MKFWIHYCTYNEYGTIYEGIVVSDVLESQETSFGTALEEVDFVLWFKRKDPSDLSGVEKSLWNTHQNYHKNSCAKLPYLKFERSKKRLDIATIATFGVSQDLPRKPRNGKQSYRKEWTEAILDQLILEVEVCRKKFKPSDDFQFDAFLEWLKSSRSIIPKNKRIAEKLRVESQKRFKIARSKMSDWEKLGILINVICPPWNPLIIS